MNRPTFFPAFAGLRADPSRWVWAAWLITWSCLAVVYLGVTSEGQTLLYDAFALGSFVGVIVGVRWYAPPRPATWHVLGFGALAMAAGEIVYHQYPDVAFPGPADALYITGYMLLALALAGFLRGANVRRASLLDAGIVLVAATSTIWTLVIDPYVEQGLNDPSALAVALVYPILDLLVLWFVVRMILAGVRIHMSLVLMASGFAAFLVSDIWWGALQFTGDDTAGLVDIGWLVGYALWGAAALHPSMASIIDSREVAGQMSNRRLILLAVAAVVPAVMALFELVLTGHVDPGPIILGSLVMFGLIVVRLFGVLEEQRELIGAHARLQDALERLAHEDPLTGLDNRRGFLDRVDIALDRDAARTAILILDLDDFKTINDSLGHLVGDDVLRILGRRILRTIRPTDTAARLGGDEFAVLLRECRSPDEAVAVAQRLLDTLSTPMTIGATSLTARCSIGIALGAQAADASTLMRSADLALYRAKAAGANRIDLFDDVLNHDALVATAIREGLAHAAERGELIVEYQPIVSLDGRRPLALEALVRWNHPALGFLMPADFIKLAEGGGAMEGIGRWVLDRACHDAASWVRAGHPDVAVNVNVSPSQLRSGTFVAQVTAALQRSRLSPNLLTLELTEAAIEEGEEMGDSLTELASHGVRLAIDDFGTGYSSLSRVSVLPVSDLKLDRSLLHGDQRMLGAIAELGRALGLRLVAEGVETAAELALAEGVGCDAAQGYLLGAAVGVDRLAAVLDRATIDAAHRPVGLRPVSSAGY